MTVAAGSDVRVVLPAHLRTLAGVHGEILVSVSGPLTQRTVVDAIEARFPMLGGTIRDRRTGKRRAFVRFYACEQDLSNEPPDVSTNAPLRVPASTRTCVIASPLREDAWV